MVISRGKHSLVFVISLFFLTVVHAIFLKKAPGFQLDEGIFADYAHRIASGETFPFLEGMTSYTTWICTYFPALLFKLFGVNQVIYRLSGVIQVLLGTLLICLALYLKNEKKTASILPGVIAFFPALVINQRCVLDATTFFMPCAGIVALGLSIKTLKLRNSPSKKLISFASSAFIVLGICAGIHAHIVFIAPVLSLYLCLLAAGKITRVEDRWVVLCICLLLLPFFFKISRLEPSAYFQSAVLVGTDVGIVLVTLFPKLLTFFSLSFRRKALAIPAILGVLLFVPFLLFLEGHWLAKASVGFVDYPILIGTGLIPVLYAIFHLFRSGWRPRSIPAMYFLPISLLLVYGMVIRAGARYLEVQFLFTAVCLAWTFAQLRTKQTIAVSLLWVMQGSLILGLNYFKPSVEERQIDTTFYLWRWREGSGGFLPKVRLLKRLAAEGCGYENIDFRIRDDNVHGPLRLLKINDWPPYVPPCRLGKHVRIEARQDLTAPEEPGKRAEGPFWLIDTTLSY